MNASVDPADPSPADEQPERDAGSEPIRVLLVDDHEVVRRGLRAMLDA